MWCGQDVQEAMMMTMDRDNWRRFVASLADHGSEGGGEGGGQVHYCYQLQQLNNLPNG